MKARTYFSMAVGLVVLLLAAVIAAGLAFPALAAPGAQGTLLPTPTLFPAENTPYTLTVVGGQDMTVTFAHADQGAFTLGETQVTSQYPRGMVFAINPQSQNGAIQDATLFVRFAHETNTRFPAEWDAERGAWVARPWDTGGQPPWTVFEFHWRVRDETGAYVDTEAYPIDYFDPQHTWFRAESEHAIVYWRGFGEDNPDAIAQRMADYLAGVYPRWVAGFGRGLSYKPVAVIFPDRDALANMYGANVANTRVAGFTSSDLGMSVQVLRSTEIPPGQENCIYVTPPEEWTMERRIDTIFPVTAHEFTHLMQYDVLGGTHGPEWWYEGQADWFASSRRGYDERLRNLATLQDLPSLRTPIGSDLNQADGCYALSYYVGASFINWLLTNYGGIDLHRQIAERMRLGASVYEMVEELTGQPFLEVENAWRAYLGFRPLTLADIDPALALEPYEDSLIQVGDTITLPAMPALVPLYEQPKPRAIAGAQCFANMPVKVLRMGQLDGVAYFEVDCMGMVGWVTRDALVGPQ